MYLFDEQQCMIVYFWGTQLINNNERKLNITDV
jgi:hypothetical protein